MYDLAVENVWGNYNNKAERATSNTIKTKDHVTTIVPTGNSIGLNCKASFYIFNWISVNVLRRLVPYEYINSNRFVLNIVA